MKIVSNIDPSIYTLSAVSVGLLLIDDTTAAEQNSLGNWFMLVGQILCTNASQLQVINNQTGQSNQSNQHIVNNSQVNMMQKATDAINKEINNMKKNI